jgi:hypothetical protein
MSDSRLMCWGFDASGEVGDGTTSARTPRAVYVEELRRGMT